MIQIRYLVALFLHELVEREDVELMGSQALRQLLRRRFGKEAASEIHGRYTQPTLRIATATLAQRGKAATPGREWPASKSTTASVLKY